LIFKFINLVSWTSWPYYVIPGSKQHV